MSSDNRNYDGSKGIYPVRTDNQHATILGRFLNDGRHLVAKKIETKNLFKLLRGFSMTFKRLENTLNDMLNGRLLDESIISLEEYERVVGSPDDCYDARGPAENRQRYTLAKLSADGVSTTEDLVWISSILGYNVTIYPGYYYWLNTDSRVPLSSEKEARFTIVFVYDPVTSLQPTSVFPYTFPFVFGEDFKEVWKRFMRKLIDANVNAFFITDISEEWQNTVDTGTEYQNTVDTGDEYQNA